MESLPFEKLQDDDRVLLIGIPEPRVVARLAAALGSGLLVILGEETKVAEARRHAAAYDNVMIAPWDGSNVPFDSRFFTRTIDLRG
ncbi:MAG: hypothetical protein K2X35_05505 [Bryobacteraceae bacterium]|nr:hypothetical protein [Bryobacteraceae bacterium]